MSSPRGDNELRLYQRFELKPRFISRGDLLGDREVQRLVAHERQKRISHALTDPDVGARPFYPES
jgi:hypothetical protein